MVVGQSGNWNIMFSSDFFQIFLAHIPLLSIQPFKEIAVVCINKLFILIAHCIVSIPFNLANYSDHHLQTFSSMYSLCKEHRKQNSNVLREMTKEKMGFNLQ